MVSSYHRAALLLIEMVENLPQAADAVLRRGMGGEIAVDQERAHAGVVRTLQVVGLAVADMERLRRSEAKACQSDIENLRLRLGVADCAGDKDLGEAGADVKPAEYLHQSRIEVGNYGEEQSPLLKRRKGFGRFRIEMPGVWSGEIGEQLVEIIVEAGKLAPGFEDLRHQPLPPLALEGLDLRRVGAGKGERRRVVKANTEALEQFRRRYRLAILGCDRGIAFADPARRLDQGAGGVEENRFGSAVEGFF
jgi:hypothetical protein